jgi:hypothetical protein
MCIQEHIGEVMKLYHKHVLLPNRATHILPQIAHLQSSSTRSSNHSLMPSHTTQSNASYASSQQANRLCVMIKDAHPPPPFSLTITRAQSDVSKLDKIEVAPHPPIVQLKTVPPTPETLFYTRTIANSNLNTRQDNSSALACHLFAHDKNAQFETKAKVVEWCRTNIVVDVIWRLNTISLIKTAGQKSADYAELLQADWAFFWLIHLLCEI